MAELRICASGHSTPGGPDLPLPLWARIERQDVFSTGRPVPVLMLHLGYDQIRVWPCDLERLVEFRDSLAKEIEKLAIPTSS